jgi:hypothetical protein
MSLRGGANARKITRSRGMPDKGRRLIASALLLLLSAGAAVAAEAPGTKSRRVVAKVEWHPGEVYPRVGFIVTNMARPAENVVAFYNKARHVRAAD